MEDEKPYAYKLKPQRLMRRGFVSQGRFSEVTTYQLICLHPPFLRIRCPHPGHLLVLHQISILETTLIMSVNIRDPFEEYKAAPIDSILDR